MENKKTIAILFVLLFIIFNLNFRSIPSADTIPATLIPFSILNDGDLYLDEFQFNQVENNSPVIHSVMYKDGHLISFYSPILPVLVTPMYIATNFILNIRGTSFDSLEFEIIRIVMEKITASFITSLSAVFLYLGLIRLFRKKTSILVTGIYALGTNTWAISSQALWQHGLSELLIALAIYSFIRLRDNENFVFLLGFSAGLLFQRPIDGIFFFAILFAVFITYRVMIPKFLFFPLVIGGLSVVYNVYTFGNIFGGYELADPYGWGNPVLYGLVSLLASPGRGLLFFTPISIFAFYGAFDFIKKRKIFVSKEITLLFKSLLAGVIVLTLVLSKYEAWWAGASYGPRYLITILPVLAYFLAYSFESIQGKKIVVFFFYALVIMSVGVQVVGTFYYPKGAWDDAPVSVDHAPSRTWDLIDNPILRSYKGGMEKTGWYLVFKGNPKPLSPDAMKVEFTDYEVPTSMPPTSVVEVSVEFKNPTDYSWPCCGIRNKHAVVVGHIWRQDTSLLNMSEILTPRAEKKIRKNLPHNIGPGSSLKTNILIITPPNPGEYLLEINLIQEEVGWFEGSTVKVPVTVEP